MSDQLFDINQVCKMLGITSRTLRFYESKGIISSTAVPFKTRRQYSAEQIEHLKRVIVLRTIGLPVKRIREYQNGDIELSEALLAHKVQIGALIDKKRREIHLLNEAVARIEAGKSIFEDNMMKPLGIDGQVDIVRKCSEDIILGKHEFLFSQLSTKMIEYMPPDVYHRMREDTLQPLGKFVSLGKIETDPIYPNIVFQYAEYEKGGLKIRYVFHANRIHGLWLGYYDMQ